MRGRCSPSNATPARAPAAIQYGGARVVGVRVSRICQSLFKHRKRTMAFRVGDRDKDTHEAGRMRVNGSKY